MAQSPRCCRERVLLRAVITMLGLIGLWFAAHWLTNLYLGSLVSYQEHFIATTKVHFILMVFTICSIRMILKDFAFTLVELAIVLIIIGFVIAGISAGISLVQASKLNAVISEIREKQTAVFNFRSRYNALPGDFPGAFAIWGTACGDGTIGGTNSCSGDGDGIIDYSNLNTAPVEDVKFWYHITASGMLPGSFTGQFGTKRLQVGLNVPASAFGSGSGYGVDYSQIYGSMPGATNFFSFGYPDRAGGDWRMTSGIVKAIEAYSIDSKIDDGAPGTGKVAAARGYDVNGQSVCVSGAWGAATVTYLLTDTTNNCRMLFVYD